MKPKTRTVLASLLAGMLMFSGISCAKKSGPNAPAEKKKITIGVMPKLVGIPFFNAFEKGAREAGKELGVEVVYDGPVTADTAKQVAIVESWIARKFDAIVVAPNDPEAIAPVLKKARQRGIRVLAADSDTDPEDREFFVSQATPDAIAKALVEAMVRGIGPEGKFIILTGSLTAANQNIWMDYMEKYRQAHYPRMQNLSPTPKTSEEDQALATQVTIDLLKTYPDLQGLYGITTAALPGAAEALRKEKAFARIYLTGIGTPNAMRDFVKTGVTKEFVLWNPIDLGYLAVVSAKAALDGSLTKDSTQLEAGRLGTLQVRDRVVLLGEPLVFNKENIDQYDF
jgi:ABC-type sugar transport system substrate-binding protein